MTIKKNKEKEPMKSAFSECPHKEEFFEKIMDFTLNQLDERILRSLETVKGTPNEWKIYYRVQQILVRFPKPQPQHVDEEEAEEITGMSEQHHYSVSDLAFIFDRSKATIHEVLNRK